MTEVMTKTTRTLEADELPCRWCGLGTPIGGVTAPAVPQPSDPFPDRATPYPPVEVGVCEACAERNEQAKSAVVKVTDDEAAIFGDRGPVRLKTAFGIASVLHALAAVEDTDEPPTWIAASYYIRQNSTLFNRLRWEQLYAEDRANRGKCATAPWSWLSPSDKAAITTAIDRARSEDAHVELVGPTTRLGPPSGGGCAWCGVNEIEADTRDLFMLGPAKAARAAWSFRRSLSLWVCPTCMRSNQQDETKAVQQAVLAATGLAEDVKNAKHPVRLPRWQPFRRSGEVPSAEPWAHLGGLDHLAEQVREALAPLDHEADLIERIAQLEWQMKQLRTLSRRSD